MPAGDITGRLAKYMAEARDRTSAVNAALANGMFGHADETDDFHPATKAHPGCSVVPAALAMAEREGRTGTELLNAVTLGYDLCCRFLLALNADLVRATHRSAEGTGSTMGAVGGAASIARLDEKGMRHALSYGAQQVSGIWSWVRDAEHVEKAFDFSGMGARNGVTAAIMAQMGFSGVWDVFDCEHNVIQALLDAFLKLHREHRLTADNVKKIVVRLPEDGARVVNDRSMPDVNCQHIIAVALVKGSVSFEDSHSYEQMKDPAILAAKARVQLIADPALMDPAAPRSGKVEVTLNDGRTVSHFTRHAPGTPENPLDTESVNAKARMLMEPVLGASKTEELIRRVNAAETLTNIRELRPFL